MVRVGWDIHEIVHYKLLDNNQTITSNFYSNQLRHLETASDKRRSPLANRKGVILHHDNARPHTVQSINQSIYIYIYIVSQKTDIISQVNKFGNS